MDTLKKLIHWHDNNALPVKVDHGDSEIALVLLHGLGNNHLSWTYVDKQLQESPYRVVIPDLLGFGDAPKPESKYTPKDHADAVITTIDKLGLKRVVLAGHSMGCIVAVEIAKQRPDLVKRLVLLGAPLYKKLPRGGWRSKLSRAENGYFTIFNYLKKNPDVTITAATGADIMLPALKGMEITDETWPAFRASLHNTIMQIETYKDIKTIRVPTLLIYGTLDVFVIKKHLKSLARANRRYVKYKKTLGPHEITPLEGKYIAKLLIEQLELANKQS